MESSIPKPARSVYNDYAESQRQGKTALAQITELRRHLQSTGALSDTAEKLIISANEALVKQQSSLSGVLDCIPVEDRRPAGAQRVIDKVFATPELIENILYYLRLHDALFAQQVNRTFFHAIQDSPRIQKELGFMPDDDCDFRVTLPITTPNIYMFIDDYTEGFQVTEDQTVCLSGDIFHGAKKLPTLGSRASKLLISQPPVKTLKFFADCCYERFPLPSAQDPTEVINSEKGVTLGQIIEVAHRLTAEHRMCPNASIAAHDADGFVRCSLYLQAKVQLREQDPRLAIKRQRREQQRQSTDRNQNIGTRLGPYIAAKQAARSNGLPIPTLDEFERSSREQTSSQPQADA